MIEQTNTPGGPHRHPAIRKAVPADTNRLAISMAGAFADDPVLNWVIRQGEKNPEKMERLFQTCISVLCLPHEHVFTTDDRTGGALWYPPGAAAIGYLQQISLMPAMIRVAGWTGLLHLASVMNHMERWHPRERHYYLQFLGVIPEQQGAGKGHALLRPVLDICNREKCGAYLENSKETNIPFYERLGFVVTRQVFLEKDAPPLWLMWRNPR